MTWRALAVALLLAGCARPAAIPPVDQPELPVTTPDPAVERAVADQPLPEAVAATAGIAGPLLAAQEALSGPSPPSPPSPPRDAACRQVAAVLITTWEVSSPSYYQRRLRYPIWPGGASGVTWGIGYDGGHQTRSVIIDDWAAHQWVDRLGGTAGIIGQEARTALPRFADIPTELDHARWVLEERSLVEYERRTARAFKDGFTELRPNACAALVSLVYNRGAAMTGDSRREMRVIRDTCVPKHDYACIASQLRSMKRLWRGTINENGLAARREAEAILAETP